MDLFDARSPLHLLVIGMAQLLRRTVVKQLGVPASVAVQHLKKHKPLYTRLRLTGVAALLQGHSHFHAQQNLQRKAFETTECSQQQLGYAQLQAATSLAESKRGSMLRSRSRIWSKPQTGSDHHESGLAIALRFSLADGPVLSLSSWCNGCCCESLMPTATPQNLWKWSSPPVDGARVSPTLWGRQRPSMQWTAATPLDGQSHRDRTSLVQQADSLYA